jgi:hypothetical protein
LASVARSRHMISNAVPKSNLLLLNANLRCRNTP